MSKKTDDDERALPGEAAGDLAAELERVTQERELAARERDELQAKLQRATADYQNLRRRQQADIDAALRRGLESLLANMLLVLDHLDLALSAPAESAETANFARGVALTRTQFLAALAQEDVVPVETSGIFDPNRHEVVMTVERPDLEPGTIVDVLRRGYTWRDKVLRVAHVSVAAEPKGRGAS